MATRFQVIDNIRKTLESIKGGENYYSTIDHVQLGDVSESDFAGSTIICGVFVSQYSLGPSQVKAGRKRDLNTALIVSIRAVIRSTPAKFEQDRSNLMDDIASAIFADPRRGVTGLPVDTVQMDFGQEFHSSDGFAGFLANIRVTWLSDSDSL